MDFFTTLLVVALFTALFPATIFAEQNDTSTVIKEDTAVTSDGFTVKIIETTSFVKTDVYNPSGQFVDSTTVDLKTGVVTYTQADGTVKISNVNDYIKDDTAIQNPEDQISKRIEGNPLEQGQATFSGLQPQSNLSIQSIYDEPITDDGLADSVYGDGYKFLGSAGIYYFDDLGYLFRKISSMTKHESHMFTFSAGTAVATALSIIVSAFSGGTWTAAVISSLLLTSSGVLVDYFTGSFDYRTYNYLYRVRVFTQSWFETFRNISYWVSYNDATETLSYKQKSFNNGFSPNNFEMVKAGIDNYMVANP